MSRPTNRRGSTAQPVSGPMAWAGLATPDHRLSSLFTKRSTTAPANASSIGILGSFPPTRCGVAGFTESLAGALVAGAPSVSVGVVRLATDRSVSADPLVVHEISGGTHDDNRAAARVLNSFDVAIIQHEPGIDDTDGDQVLDILEWVRIPVVLIVHTVPAVPTARQRLVLEKLTESVDAVVAMSHAGRVRLADTYRVAPRKVMIIPFGASVAGDPPRAHTRRPTTILTWGLLGPGKGIEWGIDALAQLRGLDPQPRYVVAGQTHPRVLAQEGEGYRDSLARRAESKGVGHLMTFEPGFAGPQRLNELLAEADVVLLPYDSHEQVTSGVLVHALASAVPVVATAFPHALELLGDGLGGMVVPHGEPAAIAEALTRMITVPGVAEAMSAHNATMASIVSWPNVAGHYRQLFNALVRRPSAQGF